MYLNTLFIVFVFVCVWYLKRQVCKPENFPPGPTWLPVLGNFWGFRNLLKRKIYLHNAFSYLSAYYESSIIGLKLGQSLIVVVSGMELTGQVFTKEEFEGRPDNFFIRLRSMGSRKGITCTDGVLWHDQRAFVVRHFRHLGFGKRSMQNILHEEFKLMKMELDAANGKKVQMGPLFAKAVLNTLWMFTAGAPLSCSSYLDKMLLLMERRTRVFDISGGCLNHFPWLRFFASSFTGYKLILDINKQLKTLFQDIIADHQLSYDPLETRDLIDAFLHKMKSTEKGEFYAEDQLIMICLDLFIAGSQTTSNTLNFAILLMILNKDIQEKAQKEIWSAVGQNCLPSYSDRSKMPYVQAVIDEVLRFCHVTPVAGPRRALRDTDLGGYTIPEDASILINVYSVHMDKKHWGDPEVFRPERFLNPDGTIRSDEWLIPFGLGRRRCLGEVLARSCLFTLFTGILQNYKIYPADKSPNITPVPGMTLAPEPYHVVLVPFEGFRDNVKRCDE